MQGEGNDREHFDPTLSDKHPAGLGLSTVEPVQVEAGREVYVGIALGVVMAVMAIVCAGFICKKKNTFICKTCRSK